MPLIAIWKTNPGAVAALSVEQVVATAGDGRLLADSAARPNSASFCRRCRALSWPNTRTAALPLRSRGAVSCFSVWAVGPGRPEEPMSVAALLGTAVVVVIVSMLAGALSAALRKFMFGLPEPNHLTTS